MPRLQRTATKRPSAGLLILAGLLAIVLIAGGGSRSDLLGQAIVRFAAAVALALVLVLNLRPTLQVIRVPLALLMVMLAINALQLIPLPQAIWGGLPGREVAVEAARVLGLGSLARPISLAPALTQNALVSLIVPFAVLVVYAAVPKSERQSAVPVVLLSCITLSAMVGLVQFAGTAFDNPLLNDTPGVASGLFANRNHQALFLASGIPLAVGWAVSGFKAPLWRWLAAGGISLMFLLMTLATGSRAGLAAVAVGLAAGVVMAWRGTHLHEGRVSRRMLLALVGGVALTLVVAIGATVIAKRAVSLDRAAAEDIGQDMRSRALPVVWQIAQEQIFVGGGGGSFDVLFRQAEPDRLLKPTYFNHAHNDVLEIAITYGTAGMLLLLFALAWFIWQSWQAWKTRRLPSQMALVGSVVIAMTFLCSLVDYPARTPIIMALLALASAWLADRRSPTAQDEDGLLYPKQGRGYSRGLS